MNRRLKFALSAMAIIVAASIPFVLRSGSQPARAPVRVQVDSGVFLVGDRISDRGKCPVELRHDQCLAQLNSGR